MRRLIAVAVLVLIVVAGAAVASRGRSPAKPPIVFVVFDALPSPMLSTAPGRLDAERFPNFARLAADATWYPNATTVNDSTVKSIPAMLDGRWPNNLRHPTLADHPVNLFTLLHPQYHVHAAEEGTELCPRAVCLTDSPRRILYLLHGGREQRYDAGVAAIRPLPKPALWYMHVLFPHEPLRYLPDGRVYAGGTDAEPGLDGNESFDNEFLTLQAEQRHLLQLRWTDALLGRLLDRLRATGLYDKALVVITADHGMSFRHKPAPAERYRLGQIGWRRDMTRHNAQDVAFVPLFVKEPGQDDGRVDRDWVRTVDILPTILRHARVGRPKGLVGRDLSRDAPRPRTLRVLTNRRGPLTLDPGSMERRRAETIARRARTFGVGTDVAQLFRIGPNAHLLGKRPAEVGTVRPSRVRVRLYGPRRYLDVRLDRRRVPAHVMGWIEGGRPEGRQLAIAVNGRIAAVAESFKPLGKTGMTLSALVPPTAFRDGRNRVQVFEATGGKLRPLRSV